MISLAWFPAAFVVFAAIYALAGLLVDGATRVARRLRGDAQDRP